MQIIAVLLVVLFFGVGLTACQEPSPQAPQLNAPEALLQQPEQQQAGKDLFLRHCRECHGTTAEGRNPRAGRFVPPAPDFISHAYLEIDPGYLYWRIAKGKQVEPFRSQGSVMPAWEPHFSEQQIWQLVAYLRLRAGAD